LTYSEGYLDKAEQLDGKLVTPPTEAGGLTFAQGADPAGNVMGIYTD
jgi:predicted enzyme related to lactoylglutathione lyase